MPLAQQSAVVEVAVAVMLRADGAFLLARRPAGKVYAGYWEFPGGKVEPGETPAEALTRELREELGIEALRSYPWITRGYEYSHATVRLNFFRVLHWRGVPQPREAQELAWQRFDARRVEPMLPANAPVLAALALPSQYAVTAAQRYGVESTLVHLAHALEAGLRLVQLRDKTMVADKKLDFARCVLTLAHSRGAKVLINSDASLARATGADGVHYSADALRCLRQRPRGILAAASCHDAAELARAVELELDFAVLGPVKETASHPGAALLGWEGFARLVRGASIPVYGIGGLRHEDLEQAWRAGAHGIAMVSGVWGG